MPARGSAAGPQQDLTWVVAGVGAAGAVAAAILGYGGAPLLLAGMVVAGWMAQPATFTGRKDRSGRPTPAHDGEAKAMRTYRMWQELRWRALVPNVDWMPGWPVRASWLAGLVAAAGAYVLPMSPQAPQWLAGANAICAAVAVWQMTGSRRRFAADQDPCPGVRLDSLASWVQQDRPALLWASAAGAAAATIPLGAVWLLVPPASFGAAGLGSRWVLGACGALGAFAAVLWPGWSRRALTTWRDLVATRSAWGPRWVAAGVKDEPPVLVQHETLGPLTLDTFDAAASQGAFAFTNETATLKLSPAFGAGVKVWVISCANTDSMGQPVVGSINPIRFRVVYCPSDQVPDLSDHATDPNVARLFLECAMATACDRGRVSRYLLVEASTVTVAPPLQGSDGQAAPPLGDEPTPGDDLDDLDDLDDQQVGPDWDDDQQAAGSAWAVWQTTWVNPDGLGGSYLRSTVREPMAGQVNLPVLVDHRANGEQGVVYVGPATADGVEFSPDSGVSRRAMEDLESEDAWRARWYAALKQNANAPRPELQMYASETLAGRPPVKVYRQPFITLTGEDPGLYFGLEAKLKATLQGAPFVAICGFHARGGRPGERHSQAFVVYWSHEAVPAGPHGLAPSSSPDANAPQWVLSGRMNEAFVAARLARPEVASVTCLTDARSRGHIWRIQMRLYGGVTLADVRGSAERIRTTLGSPWLRVEAAPDGCLIYAGVRPAQARLSNPERDSQKLVSLDWEQAWLDSKVSGVGGLLPKLSATGVLPHNEQVQVLDFELPSGLSLADVRAGVEKLKTATGNGFIEVRPGVGGASTVRLLVSESNPLPELAPFDFEFVDECDGIPFATGIEGEPVVFDPFSSPHALLAGVTGAGKSVLAQAFLYGFLVHGADVYVIDPVKGGADFAFAKGHAKAFASTPFEAVGVLKAVYEEVKARKDLNARHGVASYSDLPSDIRPKPLVVLVDEFTSLLQPDPVPPATDDPEGAGERDAVMALNHAKATIGTLNGRLAREARSAGVTLLLGTQKLTAKLLDSVPGAGDLKVNLARTLLGKASNGDRMSALRAPDEAPAVTGDIPKGRGLWEPLTSAAVMVQTWFATQAQLRAELLKRRPEPSEDERLDMSGFVAPDARSNGPAPGAHRAVVPAPVDEVIELGDVEIDWAEWDAEDEQDEPACEEGQSAPVADTTPPPPAPAAPREDAVVFLDADATHGPSMLEAVAALGARVVWICDEQPDAAGPAAPSEVLLEADGRFGWWKTGAVEAWLSAHPQVRLVVWFDDEFTAEDDLGVRYDETANDVLDSLGVHRLLVLVDAAGGLASADVEQAAAFLGGSSPAPADPGPSPTRPPAAVAPVVAVPAPAEQAPAVKKVRVLTDEW